MKHGVFFAGTDPSHHQDPISCRVRRSALSLQQAVDYAASACSLTPSALATFSTVAKLGFPSALSAR